jgi:hypothetical protein
MSIFFARRREAVSSSSGCSCNAGRLSGETADLRHRSNHEIKNYELYVCQAAPSLQKVGLLACLGMPSVLQAASVFVSIGAPVSRRVVEGQDSSFVFERYYRYPLRLWRSLPCSSSQHCRLKGADFIVIFQTGIIRQPINT